MLTVLLTSPRVAPGLLSLGAWEALRNRGPVCTGHPGHPLLPVLDEVGIAWSVLGDPPADGVWLNEPGDETVPAGATTLRGSRDLPGAHVLDLVATMDTLRTNCPWDAKQTHESLAPYLLEEPYEAMEALEDGDQAAFRAELGDVLLQVVFHARIAAERPDGYTIDDIADGIVAKLIRRHPHVFAAVQVSGADEVTRNWDEIKKAERAAVAESGEPPSALDGVPFGQPALSLAAQLQRRAARAGIPSELGTGGSGELGEELLKLVARAREEGLDPELELRAAARRYRDLVRDWERSRNESLFFPIPPRMPTVMCRIYPTHHRWVNDPNPAQLPICQPTPAVGRLLFGSAQDGPWPGPRTASRLFRHAVLLGVVDMASYATAGISSLRKPSRQSSGVPGAY